MNFRFIPTKKLAAITVALALAFAPAVAEARVGGGGSSGSRGARTFSAPPSTSTAPRTAAPIERSMTPQTQPGMGQSGLGQSAAGQARPGFFGSSLGRGLMAGLVGAGIFGLLSGSGMFGGLGSMSSFLGLIIQLGLLYLVVRFAMNWFARRQQPGMAGGAPGMGAARSSLGGMFGGGAASTGASPGYGGGGMGGAAPQSDLAISPEDFSAFERKLGEIQSAYGEENLDRLRRSVTPEMASYFAEGIAENARHGHINKVSGAKLLQGDLSEAWREGNADFATVAMRFSIVDTMVDRVTGAYVSGDRSAPSEVTEIWTFTRPSGTSVEDWKLSAIQQTA